VTAAENGAWFKLAFGGAFVFAAIVATRTARLASRTHGAPLNQLAHEVRGLIFLRAALGLVFYGALTGWLIRSEPIPGASLPVPTSIRWVAVALLLPVLWFYAASCRALGANYRGGVGLYDDHTLVTSGPYRYVRHPIYVSFIALMLLISLLSANWLVGLPGLLLVVSIAAARIPIEERQLRERFGPAWEEYRDHTSLILPAAPR
jgi:protein-S-isoprenylcysteine O-methyltransferase Ste14